MHLQSNSLSCRGFLGRLNKKGDTFLAIASGILLTVSFPKLNMGLFAWISLVPLFFAIKDKRPFESFWLGIICGLTHFGGILYWIPSTIITYGNLPAIIGYPVYIVLVFYLSLFVAGFTFFLAILKKRIGLSLVTGAPFLWVSFEYLRSLLFSGFPWEILGYSQFLHPLIIQIADITGVFGISFLIVLVNSAISTLLFFNEKKSINSLIKETLVTLIILLATIGYGYWKLKESNLSSGKERMIRVGVVQGNIDQKLKWDPLFQKETMDIYRQLSFEAARERLDIIVWPEAAVPFYFQSHEKYRLDILNISKQTKSHLLFGSPARDYREGRADYFNSAYLIGPRGKIRGRYDKVHLVPFGEYVPLKNLFIFADKMVESIGDFSPGDSIRPLEASFGKIGVLICFEGIFPDISRGLVKRGADCLINITNDAWFGKSSAPYQHLSMAAFRAVENRVFIVRSANTGVSAFINTAGKIVAKTDIFSQEVITGRIALTKKRMTFYTVYGDIFAYLCAGILLILILTMKFQGRQ